MRSLVHLAYATAFALPAGWLSGEFWGVSIVVVASASVAYHIGTWIPRGASRVLAMGWWLPPVCLVLILLDRAGVWP